MTQEAEKKEKRMMDHLEQLQSQQEQTLGTLSTRIASMKKRCVQAIMDRFDSLLGNISASEKK